MVIIAILFNASSGIAIRIPLIILGDYRIDEATATPEIREEGRDLIGMLMLLLFVLMVFLCLPPLIFFLSRPPSPPSYTASDVKHLKMIEMLTRGLHKGLENRRFKPRLRAADSELCLHLGHHHSLHSADGVLHKPLRPYTFGPKQRGGFGGVGGTVGRFLCGNGN